MYDLTTIDGASQALADPAVPAADLATIAQCFPELRPGVAAHPKAYPGLLDWLARWGDPATQQAVAARSTAGRPSPVVASASPVDPAPVTSPTTPTNPTTAAATAAVEPAESADRVVVQPRPTEPDQAEVGQTTGPAETDQAMTLAASAAVDGNATPGGSTPNSGPPDGGSPESGGTDPVSAPPNSAPSNSAEPSNPEPVSPVPNTAAPDTPVSPAVSSAKDSASGTGLPASSSVTDAGAVTPSTPGVNAPAPVIPAASPTVQPVPGSGTPIATTSLGGGVPANPAPTGPIAGPIAAPPVARPKLDLARVGPAVAFFLGGLLVFVLCNLVQELAGSSMFSLSATETTGGLRLLANLTFWPGWVIALALIGVGVVLLVRDRSRAAG